MAIDLDRCVACNAYTAACKQENNLRPLTDDKPGTQGPRWIWVYEIGPFGTFPHLDGYWLPLLCQHCEAPPCLEACSTEAIYRREDGIILIDEDRCTGCQDCITACPCGIVTYEEDTGIVSKCTFCVHRVDAGLEPACVHNCIGRALIFGDLNDHYSEVLQRIREAGNNVHTLMGVVNHPLVYYILSRAMWRS